MDWMALIKTVLTVLLGWLGYSKSSDPSASAGAAGEKLGRAESEEENANAGLREIDAAQKARDRVDSDLASNPDGVRHPDGDAAQRGSDGVS